MQRPLCPAIYPSEGISKAAVPLQRCQDILASTSSDVDDQGTYSCHLSEYEASNHENWDGAIKAMAATLPGKVTERDIAFQTMLLGAMKYSYKLAHKNEKRSKIFELPTHYFKRAENMEEVSAKSGFYLPKNTIAYINSKVQSEAVEENEKWRFLVREVLLEIYGQSISNYSAKGKRGERPPINPILFRGLFQWACQVSCNVNQKHFIDYINKFASNKRRYQSSKASSSRNAEEFSTGKDTCNTEEASKITNTTGTNESPEADEAVPSKYNALHTNYYDNSGAYYQPQLETENSSEIPSTLPQQGPYGSSRMLDVNTINWSHYLTPL